MRGEGRTCGQWTAGLSRQKSPGRHASSPRGSSASWASPFVIHRHQFLVESCRKSYVTMGGNKLSPLHVLFAKPRKTNAHTAFPSPFLRTIRFPSTYPTRRSQSLHEAQPLQSYRLHIVDA
ncbi:hypothetical protein CH063_07149 [Colletotrichum higginsianum]|uniref:Uncharacterized protein n=1 Tax=Colletotrichum higginsianum (strain IMI 349063) TaxID=759273 RepID=H1V539_COLHI|nr:hypothetical protein CH63R_12524 [Colletotrichum higginsianum IMI 349063]OBR03397.1 hypothetical protein CH63R_12524 [Colletotrichum higginsianum IMI 349063]CCF35341.1 hypothetical protein CH063_07149 [Colletotrichum higginsianum]